MEHSSDSVAGASRPARDPFPLLIGIVIVACACWTVFCHLLVFAGASFSALLRWGFAPVVIAFALDAVLRRGTRETPPPPTGEAPARPHLGSVSARLGIAAVIVLAYWLTQSYLLFWIAGTSFVAVTVFLDRRVAGRSRPHRIHPETVPTAWIAIAALAGALLTSVSHRPDWDDATYVGLAARAQARTEEALLGPEVAPYYRVHTYEPFVAGLASFTGLPVPFVYYLVLPTFMGFLVVVVQYLALRELGGGHVLGVAMILIALVSWGDDHRTIGNFAFVRLFQGKAVVVSFFVPAILYYVARYVRAPCARNWTLLALTQVAAVGFSANALVVAPLSATAFLMASLRTARGQVKHVALGLLASGYPVLLLLVAPTSMYGLDRVWAILSAGLTQAVTVWRVAAEPDTAAGLHVVLGDGFRGYLALFSLLSLAAAPIGLATHLSGARLALAILGILLNPLSGQLLKPFAESMTWRIFWTVPFPLILGLFTASLAILLRNSNWRRLGLAASATMCCAFALAPGNWTLSGTNGTRIAFPDYKVDATYWVADAAIRVTEPGGLILAPEPVAVWIPTFSNPPRVVAVRRMWVDWFPAAEKTIRLHLFDLVEGGPLDQAEVTIALREIVARRVTTVVVSSRTSAIDAIRATLGRHGYSERAVAGHRVFVLLRGT
jgi:Family of unknown function (DUF6077)